MIFTSSTMLFWYTLWVMGFAIPLFMVYKIFDVAVSFISGMFKKLS